MRFQKSQPAGAAAIVPPSASTSPLKNMDASSSARKAHAHEIHEKNWQHFKQLRTAMAPMGRYKEDAPHKAGVGANRPRAQRCIIRIRAIMSAANCSPAVAFRRAKYDGDFRVPMLLGAQPPDHTACASTTRHALYQEGGKLALGRLQSNLPVRAKTRRLTITSEKIPGLLCLSNPGRRQTAIFLLQ